MYMNTIRRVMVVLLAIASLATTFLIVISLIRQAQRSDRPHPALQAGGVADSGGLVHQRNGQLPVITKLPDFTLTERSGQPVGAADLHGNVLIVDFIFTRCGGPCPAMTSQMAELQRTFEQGPEWNQIRLVSVTVDPEYDTPEVLRRYAGPSFAQADPQRWLFLTGSRSEIRSLIQEGFKLPVGENAEDPDMPIYHSAKFVLVDRVGRIRGYYDALEEEGRSMLMHDLRVVLSEPQERGEERGTRSEE